MTLPLRRATASDRDDCRIEGLDLGVPKRFRVVVGPQNNYFSEHEIAAFFDSTFTISEGADRMGMRLSGRKLVHSRSLDFTSDGVAPGSIQVPGSGHPIVLLVDRQTTGGYPKIATVISADLPALGRLSIGSRVAFEPVTVEQAQALRRALLAEMDAIHERIVPMPRNDAEVAPRLLAYNLVSGVVDAHCWSA